MTHQDQSNGNSPLSNLPKTLLTNRYVLILLAIFAVLELYNTGLMPVLINRDKSIERAEVAEYARLREHAEAMLAEQKSITAAATAENAPKKQAADARKASAAAKKAAADAEIASAGAAFSATKSKAEAEAQAALAELTKQQAIVEKEKAKQANRKLRADTESQQIALAISKVENLFRQHRIRLCSDCDPSNTTFGQKRYVPDLPSGAELPPAVDGETPAPIPATPLLTVFTRVLPFETNSQCDRDYKTWTATLAYGAYAVGHPGCGYSAGQPDIETARRLAIKDCGWGGCAVIAEITEASPQRPKQTLGKPASTPSPGAPDAKRGTVVPIQLNVHSKPNSNSESVIGKLNRGQSVVITGTGDGDFIAIEATCADGKPCNGFVNGRREFIERQGG